MDNLSCDRFMSLNIGKIYQITNKKNLNFKITTTVLMKQNLVKYSAKNVVEELSKAIWICTEEKNRQMHMINQARFM